MDAPNEQEIEAQIELVRRVGQGDRESFARLYDAFSGVLYSIAYRVLNQHEAAEDVLQDVFVQLWEKAPLYVPERGKPLNWAITLTRNKAIDRLRSLQRRKRLGDDLEQEAAHEQKFDDRDSFAALADSENAVLVRAALEVLNDEQREAIELAFFRGLTQSEIAEQLGEPLGTVKARIRRGMMKMREALERGAT